MVPLSQEVPMAPYSMDLRQRVARAWAGDRIDIPAILR